MQRIDKTKLHAELLRFDKRRLHRLPVYYASTNPHNNSYFPYRGFIVSGFPNLKLRVLRSKGRDKTQITPFNARSAGRVYGLSIDRMKVPFSVTDEVIHAAHYFQVQPKLIDALTTLKYQTFCNIDYFIRALISAEAKILGENVGAPNMESILHSIPEDIFKIIELNILCNDRYGVYVPHYRPRPAQKKDLKAYWDGKASKEEMQVHSLTLLEIEREQLIYADYIDLQLGISRSETEETNALHIMQMSEQPERLYYLTNRRIEQTPMPSNRFESNCNSASASFLQHAINREKGLPSTTYQPIIANSFFAIGINHRIHLHDPLLINDCIEKLQKFIQKQKQTPSFLGRLFGDSKRQLKIAAAEKLIELIRQKSWASNLSPEELEEAKKGELAAILSGVKSTFDATPMKLKLRQTST